MPEKQEERAVALAAVEQEIRAYFDGALPDIEAHARECARQVMYRLEGLLGVRSAREQKALDAPQTTDREQGTR